MPLRALTRKIQDSVSATQRGTLADFGLFYGRTPIRSSSTWSRAALNDDLAKLTWGKIGEECIKIISSAATTYHSYTFEDHPANQVATMASNALVETYGLDASLLTFDDGTAATLNVSAAATKRFNIQCSVVKFRSQNRGTEELRIFKRTSPLYSIKGKLVAWHRRTTGQELEIFDRNLFEIDSKIDFFMWNDTIYIINQEKFEVSFNFRQRIEQHSNSALNRILNATGIQFPSFSEVEAAVRDSLRSQKKLATAFSFGVFDSIDPVEIWTAAQRSETGVVVEEPSGEISINFDASNKILMDEFLDLFCENEYEGHTSKNLYTAVTKRLKKRAS